MIMKNFIPFKELSLHSKAYEVCEVKRRVVSIRGIYWKFFYILKHHPLIILEGLQSEEEYSMFRQMLKVNSAILNTGNEKFQKLLSPFIKKWEATVKKLYTSLNSKQKRAFDSWLALS